MRHLVAALVAAFLLVPCLALAQSAPAPDPSSADHIISVANWLISAAQSHDYIAVVGILLVGLVAFVRWLAPKLHGKLGESVNGPVGKGLVVLFCSEAASLSTSMLAHKVDLRSILNGLIVAFVAAGGYSIVKPILEKMIGKLSGASAAVKSAAAILLLALSAPALLGANCNASTAKVAGINIGACAIGEIPKAVASVLPEVQTAITGTAADWSGELVKLESQGIDFAICSVEAVVASLSAPHTAMTPEARVWLDRGQVYLAAHGIK